MEWVLWAIKLARSLKSLKSFELLPRLVRHWRWILASVVGLVGADGAWGYGEARQLDQTIAAVREAPVSFVGVAVRGADPARDAVPFYRVAEEFARQNRARKNALGDSASEILVLEREVHRTMGDTPAPATIARLGAFVDRHAEAYRALDGAAECGFRGLSPETFHESLFWPIRSEAALRTRYLALTDRGDDAVASLLAELGLEGLERRPMAGADMAILRGVLTNVRQDTIADVQLVLSRTTPSPSALAALAAALADADEDGQLARSLANDDAMAAQGLRAPEIGGDWTSAVLESVVRPLVLRDLRAALRQRLAVLEAASRPWPERFDAIAAALEPVPSLRRMLGPFSTAIYPANDGWMGPDGWNAREVMLAAVNQAHVRAGRVAVAIERYRRDHEEELPERLDQLVPDYLAAIPVDPFTGTPLRLRVNDAGFVVYSVGQDRYDDGGLDAGTPPIARPGVPRMTGDVGVRVETRR